MKNVLTCDTRKMFIALCLVMGMVFGVASPAEAAPAKNNDLVLYMGQNEMLVGEQKISLGDSVPTLNNGRAYVPLRAVAESFGAKVSYDAKSGDITLKQQGHTVIMNTKASAFSVNGELHWMDVAPYINAQNRTMVPIRFIANGLNYELNLNYNTAGALESIHIDHTTTK